MINLCADSFSEYGQDHDIADLEQNSSCELLSDEEMMTLYNVESSVFRMDCLSNRSQVYTLESQRCVIYQDTSRLED